MAKRRARGGREKEGARAPEPPEPMAISSAARFFGDHFYTLLLVGGVVAAVVGWELADKLRLGTAIPAWLWTAFALGVALLSSVALAWIRMGREIRAVLRERRTQEELRLVVRAARKSLEKSREAEGLPQAARAELTGAIAEGDAAEAGRDVEAMEAALLRLQGALDAHLPRVRKAAARANARSIAIWVLAVLFFRSFVAEAFKIPSGSMIPTLQVGDQIFVNKFIYGLRVPFTDVKLGMGIRKPRRGEVAVFKYPRDPSQDFIKRIIGIEGDAIEMRDDVVYVNGEPMPRVPEGGSCEYEDKDEETERWQHRVCDAYRVTVDGHGFTTIQDKGAPPRSWPKDLSRWQVRWEDWWSYLEEHKGKVVVPPGHVFVMGDNRDNSNDSRYWGFVPVEMLRGKAMFIWWSQGEPEGIRVRRMFHGIE